ncbi:MAG: rRNA pseudouridine synthase [Oscillospiraceae bacterium]|nr:rRNA pseudouridine synthase [Oscillospiraceae bacterium]MDE6936462.1 rRNA pseudouridine synthase [Oscillospiraceae bacterium]
MERLQKILSAAGVCSRRKAEELIQAGRITVNGKTASLGDRADWDRDDVRLDGRALAAPAERRCLMLNKPRGYVTTLSDERGRPTVAELVADCGVRVYPVGRLDMDSQGLLLLTNDGALAHRLAHPSHGMEKEYRVTVSGRLEGCAERLSALRKLEDGSPIAPARAAALLREPGRWVLSVTIRQGLNRQVRRMCAMAGLRVHRLERVREGPLTLGDLPPGCWRPLTAAEVSALSAQP